MDSQKFIRRFRCLGLLLPLLGLTGCAGSLIALPFAPPKDVPNSIQANGAIYAPTKPAKAQPLLAVVRFPTRIEDRAEPVMAKAYQEQYLNIAKGYNGSPSKNEKNPFDNEAPHQQMLVRSTYFAMEMYEQLKKRLPPNSVALQPMSIDLDDQGYLTLKSPNMLPPSVLYVDFFAYYAPKRAFIALPESFGKYLSSVISVHTSVEGSPETLGAVAGMKQTPLRVVGERRSIDVREALRSNLVTFLNDWLVEHCSNGAEEKSARDEEEVNSPRCLTPPDSAKQGEVLNKERIVRERPFKPGNYFELPLVEYGMSVEELTEQSNNPGGNLAEPPSRKMLGAYAEVIVEALNGIDHEKAVEVDRMQYAIIYDPQIATAKVGDALTADKAKRLAVIRQFEATEKKFLAKSDQMFIDNTYKATFGDEIRKTLISEDEVHGKLVQSQTIEVIAGMLQIGAGVAGAAMRGGAASLSQMVSKVTQVMLERSKALKDVGSAFDKHFKRVNDEMIQFMVSDVGGKTVDVQTTGLDDLRAKMRELYQKVVNGKLDDDDLRPAKPVTVVAATNEKPETIKAIAPKPVQKKK